MNLLSNAVKFTPDDGHVAVRATSTERRLTVTVEAGIGIPPEDQERIFEAFHQGRRGASREEGTGLGLTLCRRIVALMGGEMTLQTEVGVGSTFAVTIPVRSADAQLGPDRRNDKDPVVVVIDDDRASLDLMSAYLDGQAYAWSGPAMAQRDWRQFGGTIRPLFCSISDCRASTVGRSWSSSGPIRSPRSCP